MFLIHMQLCALWHIVSRRFPSFMNRNFHIHMQQFAPWHIVSCRLRTFMDWSSHIFHSYRQNFIHVQLFAPWHTFSQVPLSLGQNFHIHVQIFAHWHSICYSSPHPSWGLISLYVHSYLHLGMHIASSPICLWNRQFITMFTRATSQLKFCWNFSQCKAFCIVPHIKRKFICSYWTIMIHLY
jgi:hypothetical protein